MLANNAAQAARGAAPEVEKGLKSPITTGPSSSSKQQQLSFIERSEDENKGFATLQAYAALHGYAVTRQPNGRLLVSKWGFGRELDDLAAVEAWLRRATGRSP
jgi:hypothetical protein